MNIEEIKAELAKQEKALANPKLFSLMGDKIQAKVDGLKKQLSELENKAEKKVEEAEKKVEEAKAEGTKADVKEAQADLKDAKAEEKEIEKVADKAEKVADKVDEKIEGADNKGIPQMQKPKSGHGGYRPNAGRKVGSTMKKPKGVDIKVVKVEKRKKTVREKLSKAKPKAVAVSKKEVAKKAKTKSVRAFGQTVEYKNDADFCRQLIIAFKKRKALSKKDGKRRKTKPVFGVIVTSTKNAVSKALHSVSEKKIESNPKEFLAKAARLEKSAIKFLEDFKAILGSDYKKSEISAEFGELEKSIKAWVSKFAK